MAICLLRFVAIWIYINFLKRKIFALNLFSWNFIPVQRFVEYLIILFCRLCIIVACRTCPSVYVIPHSSNLKRLRMISTFFSNIKTITKLDNMTLLGFLWSKRLKHYFRGSIFFLLTAMVKLLGITFVDYFNDSRFWNKKLLPKTCKCLQTMLIKNHCDNVYTTMTNWPNHRTK